jgi:aminoglycoside phosphotransferase (APT) family kinase protein
MNLTTPLAQGRTAEIYRWDDGHVLKFFREWCPPDWVDYEARIARAVYEAGVPSPAPGEIVEVDGRRGLVYERLDGISMLRDLNARPWMVLKHARALAELQVEIHQKVSTGLPSYKDRLRDDIRSTAQLNESLRKKSFALLEVLPNRHNICHGDFHPGNVLLTKKGPIVIDWMTACTGSPWADVARTSLILSIGVKAAGKQVRPIVRMTVKLYQRVYLNRYKILVPDREKEMERWIPVIAAARLNEEILPEREALIEVVTGSSLGKAT